MLASFLIRPGLVELSEVERPVPSEGEVLVRIKSALTCGTDIKAWRRGHPMIPMPGRFGHEYSGLVESVGAGVRAIEPGQPVMGVHSAPCGGCFYCGKSLSHLCENIMNTKVMGAFAEFMLIPRHVAETNLFGKPESISFSEAAFLEPLSCVVHGVKASRLTGGDTALVIGAGAIGLLHVMLLRSMGVEVIVVGRGAERLRAAELCGASLVIDASGEVSVADVFREITGPYGADGVFECTGAPSVWQDVVGYVRRGGTVVLFGGCPSGSRVVYDTTRIHYDEITLKGVFHFTPSDVREARRLLVDERLPVSQLVSDEVPLSQLHVVLEKLSRSEGIKYCIVP